MYERDSQTLGREAEQLRAAAVEKARRWTLKQSARLAVMPKEILAAVRRGWLPENIKSVSSKYALEDNPPLLNGVPSWHDVEIARKARAKERKATEETSMSVAFRMAAE